jgi:3-hydroxybutyryl-CoA dehydratase
MAEFLSRLAGQSVQFSKTVSESDVYLFAGITGDFSPNHVDEHFMRGTQYGQRIAHGALLVGYMSRTSTMIVDKCLAADSPYFAVSLGYDKIRFLKPVFIGQTITVSYAITGIDEAKRRSSANVELSTDAGELAAIAVHVMKWLDRTEAA